MGVSVKLCSSKTTANPVYTNAIAGLAAEKSYDEKERGDFCKKNTIFIKHPIPRLFIKKIIYQLKTS